MRLAACFGAVAILACMLSPGGAGSPAHAERGWMNETAMRTAFIGKTLDGYYADGEDWTETYRGDGRLDYSDRKRGGPGYWYFREHVFCTFYDPGQDINGGCFTAVQAGANCYEFYLAGFSEREIDREVPPGPVGRWVARASRRGEPSTCEARPTV
jgi:hypothetical protein